MTFLNKSHFLSLACALLTPSVLIPCQIPGDKLFRKEFCNAVHKCSGKQIIEALEKQCERDEQFYGEDVFLLLAQGYIFGELTFKKQLLKMGSKENEALAHAVQDLERAYAELQEIYMRIPNTEDGTFGIFNREFSLQLYLKLLNATHNLSLSGMRKAINKYRSNSVHNTLQTKYSSDDTLQATLLLVNTYVVMLTELKRSEADTIASSAEHILQEIDILEAMQTKLNQELWLLGFVIETLTENPDSGLICGESHEIA